MFFALLRRHRFSARHRRAVIYARDSSATDVSDGGRASTQIHYLPALHAIATLTSGDRGPSHIV